jgi:hypothetical protein
MRRGEMGTEFNVGETVENFQYQFMHFMGIGPEGGRCRQVKKKTTFMLNTIFISFTLKIY